MKDMIGYVIMFVLSAISFLLYGILLKYKIKRINMYYEKQLEKIYIVKDLIQLETKIKRKTDIEKYPYLSIYLSQVKDIINTKRFDVDEIEVFTLKELPEDVKKHFDIIKFTEEYIKAQKGVVKLVNSCSDILGRVYRLNHPVKYLNLEFKKNLQLRSLKFIDELCDIILENKLFKTKFIKSVLSKISTKKRKYSKTKSVKYNFINEPLYA